MNKIVKVTDDKIFIGKDDGSLVVTEKNNASWDVKVGDVVELYEKGDLIIINQSKRNLKQKKKLNIWGNIVNACSNRLPIIFSSFFVLFFVAFMVINFIPHGRTYTCKENIFGYELEATLTFSGDEVTEKVKNPYYKNEELSDIEGIDTKNEFIIYTSKYKILDKKLYSFDEDTGDYEEGGKISSTKYIAESLGYKIEYTEHTMQTLKTLSLVLFIVFLVFDLACVVVVVLNKKGIIKTANASENTTLLNSNNSNIPQTSENLNAIDETQNKVEEKVEVPKE